jgi:hypothetical protein
LDILPIGPQVYSVPFALFQANALGAVWITAALAINVAVTFIGACAASRSKLGGEGWHTRSGKAPVLETISQWPCVQIWTDFPLRPRYKKPVLPLGRFSDLAEGRVGDQHDL